MTGMTVPLRAAAAMTFPRHRGMVAIRIAVVSSMLAAVVGCGGTSGSGDAVARTPPVASPPTAGAPPPAAGASPPSVTSPPASVASPPAAVFLPPPVVASPPPTGSSPPSGALTAAVLPAVIEAEDFDAGGEGVGYHDTTAANVGGLYRSAEGVDIIAGPDAEDSFVVNNFETGEWLAYTIDVPVTGNYELALYAASVFNDSAYHVEIDGFDTTGRIGVANTGSWSSFQWTVPWIVGLPAGRHVLKIVSDQQYFDLDSFRVEIPATSSSTSLAPVLPPSLPLPDLSNVAFACSFVGEIFDCGLEEQAELPGRAEFTSIARDGAKGIRLHTEPGDNNVASSGEMERNDLWLSQAASDGYEGREAWWAHSVLFPDDFTVPTWESYVVFDFHNSGPGPWQANFMVTFQRQADTTQPGLLTLLGYGGVNSGDGPYQATVGEIRKNVWYDFVYHVRWSSGPDGFFDAWVNGKRVLSHQGPTLYAGQGVYLKLANYHNPVCDPSPACIGTHKASSVIHDRVLRASAPAAVADGPLEGVLDLVNGVLTSILP